MEEIFYKVSGQHLLELIESALTLEALLADGVDNWEGFGNSFKEILEFLAEEYNAKFDEEKGECLEDFGFPEVAKLMLAKFEKCD